MRELMVQNLLEAVGDIFGRGDEGNKVVEVNAKGGRVGNLEKEEVLGLLTEPGAGSILVLAAAKGS